MSKRQYNRRRLGHPQADQARIFFTHAPVAQLDRVSGYEPEGREFESLRARQLKKVGNQSRLFIGPVEIRQPDLPLELES